MGASPRPRSVGTRAAKQARAENVSPLAKTAPEPAVKRAPRWAVVAGLVAYCSAFWLATAIAGLWVWQALFRAHG